MVVAAAALPTSYFVAVRKVKLELREAENFKRDRTRELVADRVQEFWNVFYATARQVTGIEPDQPQAHPEAIDPYIKEIDSAITGTGILDRLASAIDNFANNAYAGWEMSSPRVLHLQSIQALIARGRSDSTHNASLDVAGVCGQGGLPDALRTP